MLMPYNPNEDRNFAEGETIYDVDGNAYTVKGSRAVLDRGNGTTSYFLGTRMKRCFTRTNPRGK